MAACPTHIGNDESVATDARLIFGGSRAAMQRLKDLAAAQGLTLEDYVVDGRVRGLALAIDGKDRQRKSEAILAAWVEAAAK